MWSYPAGKKLGWADRKLHGQMGSPASQHTAVIVRMREKTRFYPGRSRTTFTSRPQEPRELGASFTSARVSCPVFF